VEVALVILSFPAWQELIRSGRARGGSLAGDCLADLLRRLTRSTTPKGNIKVMNAQVTLLRPRVDRNRRRHHLGSTARSASVVPGGFTFNQYLIRDTEPLLFHTGPRMLFGAVREAIEHVIPVTTLRYISFSHVEADECGSLNQFLAAAPQAVPLCGQVAAMVSIGDLADRPPRALADQERLTLGRHTVQWIDAPHLPHGWECGFLAETTTRTLLCGDLFTQFGELHPAITEGDILEPSEAARTAMDYYAHSPDTGRLLERLAGTAPTTLGCMHGPAWRGEGASLLRSLASRLASAPAWH
jgi:flavorubredoxin